jgi:tripartite-type tricarboxylate transporter receptor subunit TctC
MTTGNARRGATLLTFAAALVTLGAPAFGWEPTKPIEMIATAGPGGGTDILARTIQSIITKHKLLAQPVIVVNKAGGSGSEGFVYGKSPANDPYKVVVATSNVWQQPMMSKLAYSPNDYTPIAALVQDEFMLWVKDDAPYQSVRDYLKAVAEKKGDFRMGGALAKDTDEILTHIIEKTANVKYTFIPFKSGAEVAVQLAGGHVDSHVNNPSESLGQWRGGTQRPICVFRPQRLPEGPKVTATLGWHDIPTCKEAGLDVPLYQQPRTVWLPAKVSPDQLAFYVNLMKKVQATPEWKEYIDRTSQTSVFLAGKDFAKFQKDDIARTRKVAADQGWPLVN